MPQVRHYLSRGDEVGCCHVAVREDVVHPRGLTTECVQHTFALIRSEKKEPTVLEMTEIEGKQRRKNTSGSSKQFGCDTKPKLRLWVYSFFNFIC